MANSNWPGRRCGQRAWAPPLLDTLPNRRPQQCSLLIAPLAPPASRRVGQAAGQPPEMQSWVVAAPPGRVNAIPYGAGAARWGRVGDGKVAKEALGASRCHESVRGSSVGEGLGTRGQGSGAACGTTGTIRRSIGLSTLVGLLGIHRYSPAAPPPPPVSFAVATTPGSTHRQVQRDLKVPSPPPAFVCMAATAVAARDSRQSVSPALARRAPRIRICPPSPTPSTPHLLSSLFSHTPSACQGAPHHRLDTRRHLLP